MTRRGIASRTGGLALALLPFVVGSSSGAFAEGEVDISRVDPSGYPAVVIELTAPATVTGGELSPNSVEVLENGISLPATLAVVPTSGLEVVMLIDTSGSMKEGDAISAAKNAATRFLEVLPAGVPVGIVSFADTPALVSPLTVDRGLLTASIAGLTATGETSLYDALSFARTLFSGGTTDRQIVLLSDGGDTVSNATIEDAIAVATDIRTSAVELVSSEANRAALEQVTSAGNGTLSSATDPAALEGLYETIASSLINRYRLTVQSKGVGDVVYTVRIDTADGGVIEVSAPATLPLIPPPPSTLPPVTPTTVVVPTLPPTTPTSSASSGWGTTTYLMIGAGSFFAAFLLLALLAIPAQRQRARTSQLKFDAPAPRADESKGIGARVSAFADRLLEGGDRRRGLAAALEAASIQLRPGEFLVLAICGGFVLAVVLFTVLGPIGFVIGLAVAPLVARVVLEARAGQRRRAFGEQLPDVLQMIVSSLRAGFGLPQALDSVANQVQEPARTELQRVLFEIRIGRDPTDAMAAVADRMKSDDFAWVVSAMQINREVGGELALILENVAQTARERQQLARQIRTLTAEGRLSAYVLIALPIGLPILVSVVNPDYYAPMSRAPGPLLIVVGCVLLLVGWLWMRRLIRAQM